VIGRPIYLDYNATTPVDPRVVAAMAPLWTEVFGNPASHTHAYGWAAAALVDDARRRLAAGIGAAPEEIIFTSGATEANNLAVKGTAWLRRERGRHIVTCATEHKAVLDPCARLAREGFEIEILPVARDGLIDPERLTASLRRETVLASIMLANNETGVLLPIAEIARRCRERGVLLHCDATQAVGKLPVDVEELGVDLLSFSAHKLYGPKGVGALYVRRHRPRLRLVPLLDGGGHEEGMRSGTLNAPAIVGFATALDLCREGLDEETARLAALRDRLARGIVAAIDDVSVNGGAAPRLPNTLNVSFGAVDGGALLASLREVAVSSGSACTSADPKPSHVLRAMGLPTARAAASLRFSLGRPTSPTEVEAAIAVVVREVRRLRERSPLRG
jgi:cysteine desulfurase